MAEPFVAEVRMASFGFPPKGWAQCDGQLLPINQNQALFSLLGTTYGGNGQTNFALPDLRGRTPLHRGEGMTQGEKGGQEAHTLSIAEIPTHTHVLRASSADGSSPNPGNSVLAREVGGVYDQSASNLVALRAGTVANVGGSQAHPNMMPFHTINFLIALQGIFPSRN